jgi:hypothetical protein
MFQPFGLRYNGLLVGSKHHIKKGFSSAIGCGDPVVALKPPNEGYIAPYSERGTRVLGVLVGIDYNDMTSQQFETKSWWSGTENPSGDVAAMVIDELSETFLIQCGGGPITHEHVGLNADICGAGAPARSGGAVSASTAYLDFSTVGLASTLPLRIIGISSLAWGGTNPSVPSSHLVASNLVEVRFNTSAFLQRAAKPQNADAFIAVHCKRGRGE